MSVAYKISEGKVRAESLEHCVVMQRQVVNANAEIEQQPDDYNWCECSSDFGRPERLNDEKKHQYGTRNANNRRGFQVGIDDRDALNGTEDRLGRRQHAIRHDHGNAQNANEL